MVLSIEIVDLKHCFVWCRNMDTSENRYTFKVLKCSPGEGWRRTFGQVVWKMK